MAFPSKLDEDPKNFPLLIQAYKKASAGKSITLKPGDEVPLKQVPGEPPVKLLCVCASGVTIADSPQAAANPIAAEHVPQAPDPTDNARSVGFLLSDGDFRFLDLGDLTWNVEYKLVHPTNKIGLIDVYQSTHHGLEISNNPGAHQERRSARRHLQQRTAQGRASQCRDRLRRVPGIQAIYQMHRNLQSAEQENTEPASSPTRARATSAPVKEFA